MLPTSPEQIQSRHWKTPGLEDLFRAPVPSNDIPLAIPNDWPNSEWIVLWLTFPVWRWLLLTIPMECLRFGKTQAPMWLSLPENEIRACIPEENPLSM